MSSSERLRLIGGTGSPYTRKMVALLAGTGCEAALLVD